MLTANCSAFHQLRFLIVLAIFVLFNCLFTMSSISTTVLLTFGTLFYSCPKKGTKNHCAHGSSFLSLVVLIPNAWEVYDIHEETEAFFLCVLQTFHHMVFAPLKPKLFNIKYQQIRSVQLSPIPLTFCLQKAWPGLFERWITLSTRPQLLEDCITLSTG